MSRIAKVPVKIPNDVDVQLNEGIIVVKGSKGSLDLKLHTQVKVEKQDDGLTFSSLDSSKLSRAMAGTVRALVNNMVLGVSVGFKKTLKLVGVGYRAQAKGNVLTLTLGFSHPIEYAIPEKVSIETPSQTEIVVHSIDKQLVGQVAAEIRDFRRPEPYKAKGVCYADERVRTKEAKKK